MKPGSPSGKSPLGGGGSGGGGGGRGGDRRGARPKYSMRGDRPSHPPRSSSGSSREPSSGSSSRPPRTGGPARADRTPRPERTPRPAMAPRPPREPKVLASVTPVRVTPEQRIELIGAIEAYAKSLGITAPHANFAALLVRYQEQILGQNNAVNLTTITEPFDFLVRHHLDSLATVLAVPELLETSGLNVIDVGTGAGFPGVPLWAALPQHHYTLIDGTAKKVRCVDTAFRTALEFTASEGLWQSGGEAALELLAERAETLGRIDAKYRHGFDVALARATGPGLEAYENTLSLLKPGGKLVLYFADQPARGEPELVAALSKRDVLCEIGAAFPISHGTHTMQRRHCVITLGTEAE